MGIWTALLRHPHAYNLAAAHVRHVDGAGARGFYRRTNLRENTERRDSGCRGIRSLGTSGAAGHTLVDREVLFDETAVVCDPKRDAQARATADAEVVGDDHPRDADGRGDEA